LKSPFAEGFGRHHPSFVNPQLYTVLAGFYFWRKPPEARRAKGGGGAGNRTRVRERDSRGLYMLSLSLVLAVNLPIDRVFTASSECFLVLGRSVRHPRTSPHCVASFRPAGGV